ncbi:MAG: hypothetical protein ACK5L1_01955 [Pseudanabaena sp.]
MAETVILQIPEALYQHVAIAIIIILKIEKYYERSRSQPTTD